MEALEEGGEGVGGEHGPARLPARLVNINRAHRVARGMPSPFEFPARPSAEERAAGCLTPIRLAQLEAAAAHLRKHGSVAAAAADVGYSISGYERNFSMLAKLAKWTSRLPEDYLAGRPTRHGGARRSPETPGATGRVRAVRKRTEDPLVHTWNAKMCERDRALLLEALRLFSGTANDFLAEAARRFQADRLAGTAW